MGEHSLHRASSVKKYCAEDGIVRRAEAAISTLQAQTAEQAERAVETSSGARLEVDALSRSRCATERR